jgi:NAD-dependent dihydropyrimidine dehydrogenase PreA subunit
MPISHINVDECIGCGTCVETCPADVIRIDEKSKKAKIVYPEDCQSCSMCRVFCPVSRYVITVSSSANLEPFLSWG